MVDPEIVRRRLRELDRRVTALRRIAAHDAAAFLADADVQAQAERHLQVALQAVIDIALHLVADESRETPDSYGAAFSLLARQHVIPESLAERIRPAAGLRNVLVHAYVDVDPQRVWEHLGQLDDLVAFADHVEGRLEAP